MCSGNLGAPGVNPEDGGADVDRSMSIPSELLAGPRGARTPSCGETDPKCFSYSEGAHGLSIVAEISQHVEVLPTPILCGNAQFIDWEVPTMPLSGRHCRSEKSARPCCCLLGMEVAFINIHDGPSMVAINSHAARCVPSVSKVNGGAQHKRVRASARSPSPSLSFRVTSPRKPAKNRRAFVFSPCADTPCRKGRRQCYIECVLRRTIDTCFDTFAVHGLRFGRSS